MLFSLLLAVGSVMAPSQDPYLEYRTLGELEQRYIEGVNLVGPDEVWSVIFEVSDSPSDGLRRKLSALQDILKVTFANEHFAERPWSDGPDWSRELEFAEPVVLDTLALPEIDSPVGSLVFEIRTQDEWVEVSRGETCVDGHLVRFAPTLASGVRGRAVHGATEKTWILDRARLFTSPPRVRVTPAWLHFEGEQVVTIQSDYPGSTVHLRLGDEAEPRRALAPGEPLRVTLSESTRIEAFASAPGALPGARQVMDFVRLSPADRQSSLALFVAPKPGFEFVPNPEGKGLMQRGYLQVPADGFYRFRLQREFAGRLFVDGEETAVFPGFGASPRYGAAELAAGWHRLHLELPSGSNTDVPELTWSGPGFEWQIIAEDQSGH